MAFPQIGKFLNMGEEPEPLAQRTDMEAGPAKQRRIAQRRTVIRPIAYQYTPAEFTSFKTWFDDPASSGGADGGGAWFDWVDPFDGSTKQASLVEGAYQAVMVNVGEGQPMAWRVSMQLETYE